MATGGPLRAYLDKRIPGREPGTAADVGALVASLFTPAGASSAVKPSTSTAARALPIETMNILERLDSRIVLNDEESMLLESVRAWHATRSRPAPSTTTAVPNSPGSM
jgi:hypothetical protein